MICAIMQPTYLPWAGYFNLISQVDAFVFLDDSQYQKNSWHNRNRLLVSHKPHWITIPVRHISLSQTIQETQMDSTKRWRIKHVKLISQTYSKHPFADQILDFCTLLESDDSNNLAELNIKLIKWFAQKLAIDTDFYQSSQMDLEGKRTGRLVQILQGLGADNYLSPNGSAEYLEEDKFIEQTSINLSFQEFDVKEYSQRKENSFESRLSIVDVVANIGWDAAKQYIT